MHQKKGGKERLNGKMLEHAGESVIESRHRMEKATVRLNCEN